MGKLKYNDNGTWKQIAPSMKEFQERTIEQSDIPPEGIVEGRLWLDTSDNTYQGTVFEELDQRVNNNATEIANVQQTVSDHLADYTSFKLDVGNKSNLLTTNKNNLVSAINEVFQTGNNVKSNTVGALLSVDPNLPINVGSSWEDVINAIGEISTGKKWAAGSGFGNGSSFTVSGLSFRPCAALIRLRYADKVYTGFFSAVGSDVYNSVGSNTVLVTSDGSMLSPITGSFGTSNFTLNAGYNADYFEPSRRVDWLAIEY